MATFAAVPQKNQSGFLWPGYITSSPGFPIGDGRREPVKIQRGIVICEIKRGCETLALERNTSIKSNSRASPKREKRDDMPLMGWESVDRNDPSYKACLTLAGGAGAIVGGATGSFLGPAGTVYGYLGGAAWGLTAGYLVCPYLVPPLKRKLEEGLPMTEAEVQSAAETLGRYASLLKASDAIDLLGVVRMHAARDGTTPVCRSPALVARQILSA